MKNISLMFIIMLSVSSVFSAPKVKPFEEWPNSEKERIFYNNELKKYGLYDLDGIDYDVKVELVERLHKRRREERRYYEELIANPPEGYEFTEYDKKMINEVKAEQFHKRLVQELKAEREKRLLLEKNN